MKKLLLLLTLAVFTLSYTACTPEEIAKDELQTDKDKNCPPNDRDCNGIPDDQED